jgi:hypothetical protein
VIWASLLFVMNAGASEPFWKAKEKWFSRIQEGHAIIVSVKTEQKKGSETLIFQGGGHIKTPQEFAFREAMKFENLKDISDEFKEVRWVDKTLFVHTMAYGFEAKMWLKIAAIPNREIKFEIVQGTLKGLQGVFSFAKVDNLKTEIGIDGHYDYVHFPIPKLFAEFGLEVILQRVAIRLREHIESLYKGGKVYGK